MTSWAVIPGETGGHQPHNILFDGIVIFQTTPHKCVINWTKFFELVSIDLALSIAIAINFKFFETECNMSYSFNALFIATGQIV